MDKVSMLNTFFIMQNIHGFRCSSYEENGNNEIFFIKLLPGGKLSKLKSAFSEIRILFNTPELPQFDINDNGIIKLVFQKAKSEKVELENLYSKFGKPNKLSLLIGEGSGSNAIWMSLDQNPHLLIAGSTGSGKSVLLHNIIKNCEYIENIQLYLIDTKIVELGYYKNNKNVIAFAETYKQGVSVLKHLNSTMNMRYSILNQNSLSSFEETDIFKPIVLIIDEAADLFANDETHEFEKLLVALASKGRSAGIFIIMATQRPSTDIISGIIKANFPARIACKVASKIDSMVVLDQPGAEKLFGNGDAYIKSPQYQTTRFKIAYYDKFK